MGKKVSAVLAALLVFPVAASMVMGSLQGLVMGRSAGNQNLSGFEPWVLDSVRYGSLAVGLLVGTLIARRILRWGFRTR